VSVSLSVVTFVTPAKTAEPIDMPFAGLNPVGQRNHYWMGDLPLHGEGIYDIPMLFAFFLMVPLETNYLQMCWTDLYQIFRIGSLHIWVCMFNTTFFLRSLNGLCYGNRFFVQIGENWHTPPSFCALPFHNGWEDRNKDTHINTADDPSMYGKNLVHVGSITSEFCRLVCAGGGLQAGLCHAVLVARVNTADDISTIGCLIECIVQRASNQL